MGSKSRLDLGYIVGFTLFAMESMHSTSFLGFLISMKTSWNEPNEICFIKGEIKSSQIEKKNVKFGDTTVVHTNEIETMKVSVAFLLVAVAANSAEAAKSRQIPALMGVPPSS